MTPDSKTETPQRVGPLAPGSVLWTTSAFQSGTQVVQRNYSAFEAYYHIGHLAADTEGDGGRFDVARELCDWLNGGTEPWWIDMLRRTSADTVTLPHGCEITATGPMIDLAEPPSWGNWAQDDRADARIARGLLADALMKRQRPSPNNANEPTTGS